MSPFEILGVPQGATKQDIKKAYRNKVRQWHPDICKLPQATDMMQKINAAYEALTKTPPPRQVPVQWREPVVVVYTNTYMRYGFANSGTSAGENYWF